MGIECAEVQLSLTEKGKKLATKSVHHLRVLLSRILGVAVEWGSPLNPRSSLRRPSIRLVTSSSFPGRAGTHFRHTHATLLGDLGESIKTTQALLGHRDLDTTLSVYTHAIPESQRKAVARLADVLDPSWTQLGPNLAQRAS